MNHLSENDLVLLAYGEAAQAGELESHVAACKVCRAALEQIERARVALDLAIEPSRWPSRRWIPIALGAAAVLALVFIRHPEQSPSRLVWSPARTWSRHAGYFAGGPAVIEIDSQLTRLEQGWSYGRP